MDAPPQDPKPVTNPAAPPTKRPHLIRRMYDWTISWSESRHLTHALFWISFSESSFFPIPPDVLLGPLCLGNRRKALWFAFVCTVASVLGAIAGYFIGYFFWEATQEFWFKYVPKFSPETYAVAKEYFDKYDWQVMMIAAITPLPFKVATVLGGAFAINFPLFVLACIIGRGFRFFTIAGLMWLFGDPIKRFIDKYFDVLSIIFIILLIGGFAAIKLLETDKPQPPSDPTAAPLVE